GMHFSFTGHMHCNNIASHISDNGETLYDCETASLTGFPNSFREVHFDNTGKSVKATYKTLDVDCEQQIKADGVTYKKPYKNTYSFWQCYGKTGFADFGERMAEGFVNGFFESITKQGGLYSMLENSDVNLENIVNKAIKGGLTIGDYDIFTTKNIMGFVKDLSGQIDKVFIAHPETVLNLVHSAALKLVSMPVSKYPCTKFIKSMGFGNPAKPGTLQDAGYSALKYMYEGNEDISKDIFMQDVMDFFENRNGANDVYTILKDILVNDIIENSLFSVLKFNPGTLFPDGCFGQILGDILDGLIDALFPKDQTYLNIINSILTLLPLEYKSINDVVDVAAAEYVTQSQLDSVGHTLADLIGGFVIDKDPGFKMDANVTLTYSGSVKIVPTAKDYRLPSQVAVTFGDYTDSTRSINWFTKYSVTGTDIELVLYSKKPVFKGLATKGAGIVSNRKKVLRGFPGVDLGITGFLNYNFSLVRHTIKISGLEAGKKYCYRIGDASKGWWSKTGVIETADDSDSFTFFHMTDPQSQNEKQYNIWANAVEKAFDLYPQSKFIMNTGDLTDNPANVKQWEWLLDTASNDLLSTVLMPTTGNHENKNSSLDLGFVLPDTVKQDRTDGVYYSFDYNNAHFIVLNTNDLNAKNELSDEQINWLKQDAAASNAQWKIVSLHKAMYSNGAHYDDKDVIAIRKQLCSLMPELGIDLVLQGHDHVYLRTDAMKGNRVVKSKTETLSYKGLDYKAKLEPKGSIYVISGCAGVKNYLPKSADATDKLFPRAESIVNAELPIFSAIQIDGNKLYFDAYTVDGKLTKRIDSF
ncbi:MAG: metallophosphoesterase family protein, partial [Eubacteriales bacterium]